MGSIISQGRTPIQASMEFLRFHCAAGRLKKSSMRSTPCNKGLTIMDYDRMSNAELYALLKEKMPAVAETVGKVRDSNRETIIAFLRFVQTHQDKPV